jgi:hypothetical protein
MLPGEVDFERDPNAEGDAGARARLLLIAP